MCKETTTSYRHCMAVRIHTFICLDHIDHTRLQIDNATCPKLKKEVVNSESTRCCCRDHGYSCIRRIPGIKSDSGHSWSFMKGSGNGPKIESTEEKEARRLKALSNQIRVKKNELSFLKYSENQQAESASSKRRKKNDKTSEQREGRPASVPPESSSQEEVNVSDMVVDDTAEASFSSADVKERSKKSKAIHELEREIEDMTKRWIQEGGRESGSSPETYIKPEYDSDDEYRRRRRENFDSYRPNRFRSDSYRPEPPKDRLAAKGRRSRRSGGFERGVVSGSGVTRGPDPASGANIDRVKEEPVDDIEIKEEPVDDIEMDLTG